MSYTIVFQGDSITDCGRNNCGGAGYPMEYNMGPGYAGIISTMLQGEHPEKDYRVFNRGISGNRIVDLYARWKADTINLTPDLISILVGINDIGHEIQWRNGVDPERFERFYRMLLAWSREANSQVKFILMQPFVLPFGAATEEWSEKLRPYQQIVEQLAGELDAAFIPLQNIFNEALKSAPEEYWISDGVHPTPAGHALIVNAWKKVAEIFLN